MDGVEVRAKVRMLSGFVFACVLYQSAIAAHPKVVSPFQAVAQKRVDAMAALPRRFVGHLPQSKRYGNAWKLGCRFEGTCWGPASCKHPERLPTCRPHPRRGMRLVADAVARGRYGSYRLRLWR